MHFDCKGDREAALRYAAQLRDEAEDRRFGAATVEHGRELWEGLTHINRHLIVSRENGQIKLESPLNHLKLPGLAGEIADLVYRAGKRDTRIFGQVAGLMAVSALVSPLYVLESHDEELVGLNLYSLLLGPTASGKEAVRAAVRMALEAADRGDEFLDGIGSAPALHDHLAEPIGNQIPGAVTLVLDEQGINLSVIKGSAMGHQQMLLKLLMSLFGLPFGTLSAHKVRDKSKIIPSVKRPRTCTFWTSTPGAYLDAVDAKDSESGKLNRFLTFWLPTMPPLRNERAQRALLQEELPPAVAEKCARFKFHAKEAQHAERGPDQKIKATEEARTAFDDFEKMVEITHIQGTTAQHAESWSRAAEYLKKISGLLAVSENPNNPICTKAHVDLAETIVEATVGGVADLVDTATARKVMPDTWEKVLSFLESSKDATGCVSMREVTRGPLKNKDNRNTIIADMIACGVLEEVEVPTTGRPKRMLRAAAQD